MASRIKYITGRIAEVWAIDSKMPFGDFVIEIQRRSIEEYKKPLSRLTDEEVLSLLNLTEESWLDNK